MHVLLRLGQLLQLLQLRTVVPETLPHTIRTEHETMRLPLVTNQENQPINLKDVSATSGYVDMKKEQLKIDKRFNTYDGVTY